LSSYIQQRYIEKFDECWIPDVPGENNLSGILGHKDHVSDNIKYIGVLSRFEKRELTNVYDYLVLLSGPEPQRSMLESILLEEFKNTDSRVLFIRGIISQENLENSNLNITIRNYSFGKALEEAINSSRYIISRSGYTTLMDLSKLEKKAFFIPTPGQEEQKYLAKRIEKLGLAAFCSQENFTISKLDQIEEYSGLSDFGKHTLLRDRLTFFHSK